MLNTTDFLIFGISNSAYKNYSPFGGFHGIVLRNGLKIKWDFLKYF